MRLGLVGYGFGGGATLDDRQVPWGGVALDANLVAGALGHPRGAPALHWP